MKSVLRSAKNFTKGYSDIQIKVREATSNEDWGPTMTQLEEIARASFNPSQFADIIYIIDKRLNDHGKNWRHVYKTLLALEYCICCGADTMVTFAKERLHEIKTLKEFISMDDHGHDNGACVREKCKDIVGLLTDENTLMEARRTKQPPVDRRRSSTGPLTIGAGAGPVRSRSGSRGHARNDSTTTKNFRDRPLQSRKSFDDLQAIDEETAMKMALEESKAEYESMKATSQSRDSAYDSLMEHVSRSSSARSSVSGGERKEDGKKGSLTAEQLLDLDDDAFAQALDSSYSGSKRNSMDIFSNALSTSAGMSRTLGGAQLSNGPTFGSSFPPPTVNMGMPIGGNPFELNMATNESRQAAPNPFENMYQETLPRSTSLQQSSLSNDPVQQPSIHPIAIPGVRYADLSLGAKPVMPGNMAPQFANKPADPYSLEPTITVTNTLDQKNEPRTPVLDQKKELSKPDRDPFADLF